MSLLRIGEIISKPAKLSGTGKPYYVFTGDTFDGPKGTVGDYYNEITSNKNWVGLGKHYYDYLFCRNQVMLWTATIGWSGLTLEEKKVSAENFAVGETERLEVYSNDELQTFWNNFIIVAENTRKKRWHAAKGYISYVLPLPDSIDLGKKTNDLSNEYIIYGIEDAASDGVAGLFDWLDNTNIYSGGTGFSGQTYWTQEHQDKMMDILRNGNY